MPTRSVQEYVITKAKLITDLSLPETPISWELEDRGRQSILKTRRPDLVELNTPVSGVTRRTARYILTPFGDLRTLYFLSIPLNQFDSMQVFFDSDSVRFMPNQVEIP